MKNKRSQLWARVFGKRTVRSVFDAANQQALSIRSYLSSELCRVGSESFEVQSRELQQLVDECVESVTRTRKIPALPSGTSFHTRSVLAGAYRGKDIAKRNLLTHLMISDWSWCGCRQDPESLADQFSNPEGNYERPTCPTCAAKWDYLSALGKIDRPTQKNS